MGRERTGNAVLLRDLQLSDLKDLEPYARVLPNPNDPSYFIQHAIEEEGRLVGAILVKLTSELTLILGDVSPLVKGRILLQLYDKIKFELVRSGVKDTHAFVLPESDSHHAEILSKHFGFVRATGIPMYWSS